MTDDKSYMLIDLPMPIETPRLTIRLASPGDGAFAHAAKSESWDQLHRWMPWAKTPSTPDEDEIVVREAYAKSVLRQDFMMFAFEKATGEFAIGTGIHRLNWPARYCELGYWARKGVQGRGLVQESTNALIRYAFNALGMRTVAIAHAEGNDASKAVIRKLGFTYDGALPGVDALPEGSFVDHHYYRRTDTNGLPDLHVTWG